MGEEDAVWGTLSSDEHRSVWEETEQNFWSKFAIEQKEWRAKHQQEFGSESVELRAELTNLAGQKNQLTETQERVAKQLAKVESDLRYVIAHCDAKSNQLAELDQSFTKKLQDQMKRWDTQRLTMKNFFREKRGEPPLSEEEANELTARDEHEETFFANSEEAAATPQLEITTDRPAPVPTDRTSPKAIPVKTLAGPPLEIAKKSGETLVDVIDVTGNVIGPIERIESWNKWVDAVVKLPIRRPVTIRPGRRFTTHHLNTIYERTESKGVKWLSCMIQATGVVQSQRCQSCDKNQGVFNSCIIVGGDVLPKCGNCEWNRQGCHGASGETLETEKLAQLKALKSGMEDRREAQRITPARSDGDEQERRDGAAQGTNTSRMPSNSEEQTKDSLVVAIAPPSVPASWRTILNDEPTPEKSPVEPVTNGSARNTNGRTALPDIAVRDHAQRQTSQETGESTPTSGFTAANSRSRPNSSGNSYDFATPNGGSAEPSPPPNNRQADADDGLEEINSMNLALRHNGEVYTHPECMKDVPVAKIDKNHPYWDPFWKDIRIEISQSRDRWIAKQQAIQEAVARNEPRGSSKYQAGRQVNRGTKILEFLDAGEISPYQLLAKRYVQTTKGGITSYDTLFRLCETILELHKYKINVPPIDWIRHRLHEILTAEGEAFNLARTMHDFYHDPKLSALRSKHGYKNIGRPSVGKGGLQSLSNSFHETPQGLRKRKSATFDAELTPEPSRFGSPVPSLLNSSFRNGDSTRTPERPSSKRARTQENEGSISAEWQADSPGGREDDDDRYAVMQIKEDGYSSPTDQQVYWAWHPAQGLLQLRGLPAEDETRLYPLSAGMDLTDILSIRWNIKARCISITRQRRQFGAITVVRTLCGFSKESTCQRFLEFCEPKKITLISCSREEMEQEWERFPSREA